MHYIIHVHGDERERASHERARFLMPRSTLGGGDGGPGDPRGRVGGKREKRNKTKCLPEPLGRVTPRHGAFAYVSYVRHICISRKERRGQAERDR